MKDARASFLSSFAHLEARLRQTGGESLHRLRKSGIERFGELGFPTTKDEEWKYTPLSALAETPFEVAGPNGVSAQTVAQVCAGFVGVRLVFLNGQFEKRLSSVGGLPPGTVVCSLKAGLREAPSLVERHLGHHAPVTSAFTALNNAFIEDGALVYLPPGTILRTPIYLVFVSSAPGKATMSHPRNLIVAGQNSEATVVEAYLPSGEDLYFTNAVSELALEQGAHLEHYTLQNQSERAFHVGLVQASQQRDSRFTSHLIALGSAMARNEVRTVLGAEGGACTLNGLYMAERRQHLDQFTSIDHANANCTSRELYKGVLDGRATGVFSGRIRVHPDAQKTDASQTNKNLLLSDDAVVDTKPQLEIFADDVKCTHGAAVGQLDEAAVFYLRSRGISREDARSLLTYAFASEMVQRIRLQDLKARVQQLVASKLPGGRRVAEVA